LIPLHSAILAIESSCDETAAAVVEDGVRILSNIVSSQVEVHRPHGGVVPELASRHHVRNIVPVVERALAEAGRPLEALAGIAVTRGPGLAGALLVGLQMAKALAYARGLPLVGVNHLEGHLSAPRLVPETAAVPERHVALLVSGGHTLLVEVAGLGRYRLLGASRDDAAGEAFDKVAKLLGLDYPGGPAVEQVARAGRDDAVRLPRALRGRDELDFSFSGLKTAVATHVREHGRPEGQDLADLCASFQRAVADVLARKTARALAHTGARALVAAGGVLANATVRRALGEVASQAEVALFVPPVALCTDNAAMIAAAGALRLAAGERSGLDLSPDPRLPLA
jgi:N6-L-threonylcarbamoyladenine synthase